MIEVITLRVIKFSGKFYRGLCSFEKNYISVSNFINDEIARMISITFLHIFILVAYVLKICGDSAVNRVLKDHT